MMILFQKKQRSQKKKIEETPSDSAPISLKMTLEDIIQLNKKLWMKNYIPQLEGPPPFIV